jgi:adenylate cyclase
MNGELVYRVLVVDDEPGIAASVARLLTHHGFDVKSATDADDAMARTHGWIPHGIVCDAHMPRISGAEFLAAARIAWPEAVQVLMTGDPSAIDRSVYDAVVEKPWDRGFLERRLDQLLAARWEGPKGETRP